RRRLRSLGLRGCPLLQRNHGAAEQLLRSRRPSHHVERQPRLRSGERTLHLRQSCLWILAHGQVGKTAVEQLLAVSSQAFSKTKKALGMIDSSPHSCSA